MTTAKIHIRKNKIASILRQHPWVFSGAIHTMEGEPQDGDLVSVIAPSGACLGVGHYQTKGSISVRIISFENEEINADFWQKKFANAIFTRKNVGLFDNPETDSFRLIHAEGDGLPGLVIDWYNGYAIVQPHSSGMRREMGQIEAALKNLLGDKLKGFIESGRECEIDHCEIMENGNKFYVNWRIGQKTGFFLDQRENRQLLGEFAKDKTVLNAFCYSGGFSVYALKGGAKKVYSLDSSKQALEWAEKNVEMNDVDASKHVLVKDDAISYLKSLPETFDLIVLDPPAFAKHLSARHKAIQAYRRLNAHAFSQIKKGGIVFTFSCSQAVNAELFKGAILAAGIDAGRSIRILKHLHQPADHPINLFHPESEYLKGFILQVD